MQISIHAFFRRRNGCNGAGNSPGNLLLASNILSELLQVIVVHLEYWQGGVTGNLGIVNSSCFYSAKGYRGDQDESKIV
eukprot:CFRG8389T1